MVLHPFTQWLLTTAMRAVYRQERLKGIVYLHRAGLLISHALLHLFAFVCAAFNGKNVISTVD